jgi:asparagine synthase (glutamine-hydrolysing)
MCGIAGIYSYGDPRASVRVPQVQAMCDAIVHRGPDDQGQYVCGPVGLGMRRLSIIDLAGGHQPMQSEDGAVTIVYNGEIYNYRELRRRLEGRGYQFRTRSDTESILHAYQEYGPNCLEHLNGMFAIAIWDGRRRRLFVARDRIGIKPLYLADDGVRLRFASEMKALLGDRVVPRELDEDAFAYFLRYGYVAPPATLLKGVRKLPPAHYLLADAKGVTIQRYWDCKYDAGQVRSEAEHAEALYEALKQSVRRQLVSDVPLGAFLSGGMDSGSIVHAMSEVADGRINTYSIGFGRDHAFHDELDDARFLAGVCRTNHHEIVVQPDASSLLPELVYHLDEPLADSSFVVTYLVAKLARETVKVILSGVGGDELFGGYRRYLGPQLGRYYQWVPGPIRHALAAAAAHLPVDRGSALANYCRLGRAFVMAQELPTYEQYDHAVQLMPAALARHLCPSLPPGESPLAAARRAIFAGAGRDADRLTSMLHLDLKTSLVESLLMLTDKMTMAVSLEARVPFLDHELVEIAAAIPPSLKVKGTTLRHIQRRSMEGRLPDRVLGKRKRGFGCPIGAWLRRDADGLLAELLSARSVKARGLFAPEIVAGVVRAHADRREDYSDLLLALATSELWFRQWMD